MLNLFLKSIKQLDAGKAQNIDKLYSNRNTSVYGGSIERGKVATKNVIKIYNRGSFDSAANELKYLKLLETSDYFPDLIEYGIHVEGESYYEPIMYFIMPQYDYTFYDFIRTDIISSKKLGLSIAQQWDIHAGIMKSVLYGLEYMHTLGIYHGDIKPANIMYCGQNFTRIKIIDFEQVGVEGEDSEAWGTDVYNAPESLINGKFNQATDIWQFAVFCHEITHGLCIGDIYETEYRYGYTTETTDTGSTECSETSMERSKQISEVLLSIYLYLGPNTHNCGGAYETFYDQAGHPYNPDIETAPRAIGECPTKYKNFLLRGLSYDAAQRPSARQYLDDPWLKRAASMISQ